MNKSKIFILLPPLLLFLGLITVVVVPKKPSLPVPKDSSLITFGQLKGATLSESTSWPVYPPGIQLLQGERVTLRGVMGPLDNRTDFLSFLLLPEDVGLEPQLQEMVFITKTKDDDPWFFVLGPVQVSGILSLADPDRAHPGLDQGFFFAIDEASVDELTPTE
ncbi:MAG: hypothetical protein AAF191_18525 [Verrucomicrobiota bacterium]